MYKPDEPGVFRKPCYLHCTPCGGKYPQPTNLKRGVHVQHFAFLLVLVTFDVPRKIFKQLKQESSKT
jgi:hypothetical protein